MSPVGERPHGNGFHWKFLYKSACEEIHQRPSGEIKCINVKYWVLSEQHKWSNKLNKGIVQHYKNKQYGQNDALC